MRPSVCEQSGCINFEGRGDYDVIGASMSLAEDKSNCQMKESSSALLIRPGEGIVKKAILYWSASGSLQGKARVKLNGKTVVSERRYRGGYNQFVFYGAQADVTSIVQDGGIYTVSDMWYDNSTIPCKADVAMAAWSLVVLFDDLSLAPVRVNICTDYFKFTFPIGTYSSRIQCIDGSPATKVAKVTVVTFESDAFKTERFFINKKLVGENLFSGTTGPNFDIRTFDILRLVRSGASEVLLTIKTIFETTRRGGVIEGLFMPVRVVKYTL